MLDPAMLDRIGHVPSTYVHHPRPTVSGAPLVTRGSVFKWYRVFPEGDQVSEALDDDARAQTIAVLDRGTIDPLYGMGFVVLHHSTELDFLFICSWRGHQELWDSLFFRPVGERGDWTAMRGDDISPVCCVWEMAPIWHERDAWIRYLISERSRGDRLVWLEDTLQGFL